MMKDQKLTYNASSTEKKWPHSAKASRGKQEYKPNEIEARWQKVWEERGIFSPNLDKSNRPFYNLMMFPYPSAEGMHVGNMYAFTGSDIYGRFKRMQGYQVFEPIGLDGFGIHSENYALKIGRHPKEQAKISQKNFYRQLRATGNAYDWTRTVETYDPDYYRWTQWIFVKLFKAGLAYRKKAPVNFCPSCKTVLADEQVVDGRCERCSSVVGKRELEQWFFKITAYADRLLNGLNQIDWSEKVKIAQRQWIGKSEGAKIKFPIVRGPAAPHPRSTSSLFASLRVRVLNGAPPRLSASLAGELPRSSRSAPPLHVTPHEIEVFTTRQDTLFGATFLVLAPEHPFVASLLNSELRIQNSKLGEVKRYVDNAKKKTEQERIAEEKEKTGVFTGIYAINPVNQEKIPVWIADYAVMGYGTGALFGDAHDERDVAFAKKYGIPLKPTLVTGDKTRDKRIMNLEECFTGYGTLVDSGEFSGLISAEAKKKIAAWLREHNAGGPEVTYHLRDWLISRQRYWGPPIPMIFCQSCAEKDRSWFNSKESKKSSGISNRKINGKWNPSAKLRTRMVNGKSAEWNSAGWHPVPEDQLPVELPYIKDYRPLGTGKAPLANHPEFYEVACPECNGPARRETDASDTFLDSAWYFFRYISTEDQTCPWKPERARKWLPVNMYIGGAEHSVLHLMYARFITMAFRDWGLISHFEEPFSRFYAHGLLISEGAKMSKSRGNVVIPDEYIKKYGADTLRLYLMFLGPFSQGGDFRDTGIEGMHRFVKRLWSLFTKYQISNIKYQISNERKKMLHKTIKKVTEDIENLRYNTAIAKLMEWHNYLNSEFRIQNSELTYEEVETFLKLLAPFAPHMTEELWSRLQITDYRLQKKRAVDSRPWTESIHKQPWPSYDPKYLREEEITIVVQVNGKVRDNIKIKNEKLKMKNEIEEEAKKSEKVRKYLEGKEVKKVVYVEGKIINFVLEDNKE